MQNNIAWRPEPELNDPTRSTGWDCLTLTIDARPANESRANCLTGLGLVSDDAQLQRMRDWRARNREKVAAYNRARHAACGGEVRSRKRAYYQQVRKARDATDEGRWKDRDKKARRREAAQSGSLTHAEWLAIVEQHSGNCAYCGRADLPLEQDHVLALSKGGEHTADNVVPACKPCNSRKGNR